MNGICEILDFFLGNIKKNTCVERGNCAPMLIVKPLCSSGGPAYQWKMQYLFIIEELSMCRAFVRLLPRAEGHTSSKLHIY